jgi:hypothetical protein
MKIERIVRASPPKGFRWKVIVDGKLSDSGTAATETEAREGEGNHPASKPSG